MKTLKLIIAIIFLSISMISCKKEKEEVVPTKTYDMSLYKSFEYSIDGYKYVSVLTSNFQNNVQGQPIVILLSNGSKPGESGIIEKTLYCSTYEYKYYFNPGNGLKYWKWTTNLNVISIMEYHDASHFNKKFWLFNNKKIGDNPLGTKYDAL